MERSMPPYSAGMLRLLNPASLASLRNARSLSSSISPRSAISTSKGWSFSVTNRAMRPFNSLTSSEIPGRIRCSGAVVMVLSPLFLGEGKRDRILQPVRVFLPREPRQLHVFLRQVAQSALGDQTHHRLPKSRSPHHAVPACGQHVKPFPGLVDDREVVRRIVYGCGPRPRHRYPRERRMGRFPVGTHLFVVVPVEADLVAPRSVRLIDRVAHAKKRTLLLGPPVVPLAHVEYERKRVHRVTVQYREGDDLMPHRHDGHLYPGHGANLVRPPRPAGVNHPLRLEEPMPCLHSVMIATLLDTENLAHLEQVNRLLREDGAGGVAGRDGWVDVAIVRGVGGPHETVPGEIREPPPPLLRLDPLILDPGLPTHADQPQEALLLLLRLGDDVIPGLPEARVEPKLLPEREVQFPGELAEPSRRLGAPLLAYHPRRTAGRPTPGPAALEHRDPPETAPGQPVSGPQTQVAPTYHHHVVDRHLWLLLFASYPRCRY